MELTITEVLFMFSTAIALPVITVLTFAYFSGGLRNTENARFLPVMEEEHDWWNDTTPTAGGDRS